MGKGLTAVRRRAKETYAGQLGQRTCANLCLKGIAKKARQDGKYHFCDVYRLINEEMLLVAWSDINKKAVSGADRVTAAEYEESLMENIRDLVRRLKEKRYSPKLARRVYIPKSGGRQRPLDIPALEEKLVQSAAVKIDI